MRNERKHCFLKLCRIVNILPQFYAFHSNAWTSIPNMGFHLRVSFFCLLQTCSFYVSILILTLAKLRRMQIQISNVINRKNKHNKRGYTTDLYNRPFYPERRWCACAEIWRHFRILRQVLYRKAIFTVIN